MSSNEEMIKWLDGVAAGFPKSHIVNDVIAALSPVMPDDVAAIALLLRHPREIDLKTGEIAADMLERQQQRIAELEGKLTRLVNAADAARDDLLMRAEVDSNNLQVVNMSNSIWERFCDSLNDARLPEKPDE